MDISKLTRNKAAVFGNLVEREDLSVVSKKGCKIYIPTRYEERDLATVGLETRSIGIFGMVLDDKEYAVCSVNAMIGLEPSSTSKIRINEDEYFEFVFGPGAVVFKSTELMKNDSVLYRIYNEIFSKGNVPWYLGYEDLSRIFETAQHHAGANIGQTQEVIDLLVSLISRNKEDRTQYYRTFITERSDLLKHPPAFIALKSVTYASTNTTNKIAGSYFSTGVSAALVYPAERTEAIESILRR